MRLLRSGVVKGELPLPLQVTTKPALEDTCMREELEEDQEDGSME